MSKGSLKGSAFERSIAVKLSKWWSKGKSETLFWRTAGSGARATTRAKTKRDTQGHYGDLSATSSEGKPFLEFVTLEIKRGYGGSSLADLLDKPVLGAEQRWEEWIRKAIVSYRQANSFSWMIIAKRDRRETIVAFPTTLLSYLCYGKPIPNPTMRLTVNLDDYSLDLFCMNLDGFLDTYSPDKIMEALLMTKNEIRNENF